MILQFRCKQCGKSVSIVKSRELKVKDKSFIMEFYSCGHFSKKFKDVTDESEIISIDGHKLFDYQKEGVDFVLNSKVKCLIADEMGLGKTIQAIGTLHKDPKLFPALIICKAALTVQWQFELLRWIKTPSLIIKSSKDTFFKGFKVYITSYDLLRRLNIESFPKVNCIILDECQYIKNHESKRTNNVRLIISYNGQDTGIIALSGYPIKNKPSEYFPILNILRPDLFPQRKKFIYDWVETHRDWNNGGAIKEMGLVDPKRFRAFTKDFVKRRTREEVLPSLPKGIRNFKYLEFKEEYQEAYDRLTKEFTDYFDETENPFDFKNYTQTLGFLARMRQLAGIAKVEAAYEFIDEFLLSTERKIVIFLHHHNVAMLLKERLKKENRNFLELTAEMDAEVTFEIVNEFKKDDNCRILIASTLSKGEGINLQFCSDTLIMERQWNPANEEQAESRFQRIGQENPIGITYLIAIKTIDEMLTQIVEHKRAIMAQAMEGKDVNWEESQVIKELAEAIYRQSPRER